MTPKFIDDMNHITLAAVTEVDVLVSWNFSTTLVETLVDCMNALEERVAKLEGQISKNSHNSHKPPSRETQ